MRVAGFVAPRSTQESRAYRVATISRLLQNLCLFCKSALYKRRYSAKETYNFKEPTNCNHPIVAPLAPPAH